MKENPIHVSETLTRSLLEKRDRWVSRGIGSAHSIFIDHADGATLRDVEGKEYLDFTAGLGVMNVGHHHPHVIEAVRAQLERFVHTCFQVSMYEPYVALAERLSLLVGAGQPYKAILLTTGSEAIENAVKIARSYTGRPAVVAFTGGFHGRTLLALTLTASGHGYRQNFGPFAPEVYHVPFPYEYQGWTTEKSLEALSQLFETRLEPDRIAAIIIEPQLGEGGFVPAPLAFLKELRRITAEHGVVLILDEIQTGFGRTGKMFAYEHYGIQPDLVAVAKSLAAGLPLSGVVGKAAIMDAPWPGGLGGTYGGNPLACVAALAVLDIFARENLLARAEDIGRQLRAGLQKLSVRFPQIGDVRGLGAMLALEFVEDRESRRPAPDFAQRVVESARGNGLLLLKSGAAKNVIRLLPPLTANPGDVERGLEILEIAISEVTR
jgi:4-aminobutyrate aminotransferase / (S)-3-amino-2-methylpropionate transaminase / 5-aminovalerate transaminase